MKKVGLVLALLGAGVVFGLLGLAWVSTESQDGAVDGTTVPAAGS